MNIKELFIEEIERIKRQYKCQHRYKKTKEIYGDMIIALGYRSVWHCQYCDKRIVSNHLDKY